MNPHLRRLEDPTIPSLQRAYARLDHIEATEASKVLLVAFDLVDAQWLDAQGQQDPLMDLEHPWRCELAWAYRKKQKNHPNAHNPFESMPTYRLELEMPIGTNLFEAGALPNPRERSTFPALTGALESSWFEFEVLPHRQVGYERAKLYNSLFTNPVPVYVQGKLPSSRKNKSLSGIFSLNQLPTLSTAEFEAMLSHKNADYLAVYDVGQGNANAIMSMSRVAEPGVPTLYYDLGAGVYRNQSTTPFPLSFCFTDEPPIVLSHWDADHWAGAYAVQINGHHPALKRTWIAPLQDVSPLHVAFAYDVIANGGKILIYSASVGTIGVAALRNGKQIRFTLGKGPDRNDSGIVLAVEAVNHPSPRSWLLTGDCDYRYFVSELTPLPPVAMVVPHHGADLDPRTPVPKPPAGARYKRLLYSFGPDNSHGATKTRHPTSLGMSIHNSVDWDHQLWDLLFPGECLPRGDVLATCEHTPGTYRSGALAGWDGPPLTHDAPCGGGQCKTPLDQD
ncbi:hypothetical protein ACSFE6_27345 [Pseudomonas baetica]|uniref:hypothetical protein n=1 Tax=Pseudomonas baetica TaxID=674054 RepID=UPI003EE9ADB6